MLSRHCNIEQSVHNGGHLFEEIMDNPLAFVEERLTLLDVF